MIHTTGGSWDEISFKQNTGKELQHKGDYMSWIYALQNTQPLVVPQATL